MVKTILFGNINSRKKFTKKIVISGYVEDGVLQMTFRMYEKNVRRWQYITDDVKLMDCSDPEFIELKKIYLEHNNRKVSDDLIQMFGE